jgi:hypothetical protein
LTEDYCDEEYPDEDYLNLNLPVPDWHIAIVEERMARYANEDVTKWTTLEKFEKELEEFMNSLKE